LRPREKAVIFKIKFKHATAQALAVEPREKALGETKIAIAGGNNIEQAKLALMDVVMGHEDDLIEFESFVRLNNDFVEIFS
jgi:hypothetical protein